MKMRCMKKSALLRSVIRTTGLLPLLLGCSIAQAAGYWVSESVREGKEGELCKILHKRLNNFNKNSPQCTSSAIETYSEFSDVPWENLDPKENFELIVKLERFAQEGPRAYFNGPAKNPDSVYRRRAEDFIKSGGEIQVWRAHLVSFFDAGTRPASPGEQTIVRLTAKLAQLGLDPLHDACSGRSAHGWVMSSFFVLPDLSGPDPQADGSLTNKWPMIYHDKPIVVTSDEVYWPDSVSCMYRFVGSPARSVPKRKEK